MAVARVDPVQVRQYNPGALQTSVTRRTPRIPVRTTAAGVIVLGTVLQRLLVAAPVEPVPAGATAGAVQPGQGLQVAGLALSAPPHVAAGLPAASKVRVAVPHQAQAHASAAPAHLTHGSAVQVHRTQLLAQTPPRRLSSSLLPAIGPAGDVQRTAMAPNLEGLILHVPSVSVAEIRSALTAAHSPILSTSYADNKDAAEYIWDSGRVLGVDPAIVMAIFRYESAYGTRGVAQITQSVGNIRPLAGQPSYQGYRSYGSWQEGIDDCYRLLLQYARHGAATVADAIPTWAPADDNNDPGAYVAGVMQIMTDLYQRSIGN